MQWPQTLSLVMVLLLIGAALAAWYWYFVRRPRGTPLLEYQARRPVPWGMIDVALAIFLAILVQMLVVTIWRQLDGDFDPNEMGSTLGMLLFSVTSLATWAVAITIIHLRTGATLSDFGASRPQPSDVQNGVVAFCLLLLPVFGVQLVLSKLWQESQHPLIDMLREEADPMTFVVSALAAVIVAPLVEEFFFRVLLQGWLENMASLRAQQQSGAGIVPSVAAAVFLGGGPRSGQTPAAQSAAGRIAANQCAAQLKPSVPSATDNDSDDPLRYYQALPAGQGGSIIAAPDELQIRPRWWPIVVSAALFAIAHIGNGPDPVPLFMLALGLGWLYRQTHSVWPCIIVHMLLNGLSMSQLWLLTMAQ